MDEHTSGLVESLKVGYDFGIVYIRDEDTDLKELFIIWVTIGDNFLPDSGEFGTAIVSRASGRGRLRPTLGFYVLWSNSEFARKN